MRVALFSSISKHFEAFQGKHLSIEIVIWEKFRS